MGMNTRAYKSLTFGVSALYTGVGGRARRDRGAVRGAGQFRLLPVDHVSGRHRGRRLASISGAIFGALFIQFVPNFADQISKAAPWAVYGVFLIAFMYLMPIGHRRCAANDLGAGSRPAMK